MNHRTPSLCVFSMLILLAGILPARGEDREPVSPKDVIRFFNGDKLDGLYTWLERTKYEDPDKVLTVKDGVVHFTGDENGYMATKKRYKDYHLVVEYRWGQRTFGSRKTMARSSGVFLHCDDTDGAYLGQFMAGLECQIIEGGTGDFELIPGKRADGSRIPLSITVETAKGRDYAGQPVWQKGGPRVTLTDQNGYRVSWFEHDQQWENVVDYRPKHDLASPGKEWTRLDIVSDGGHVQYRVNGVPANEAFDVSPSSGKICLQCEGAEMDFRRFELHPLTTDN
ncbi:MAG: DUF1080 domain-containing protein [Planctomycetia bacterium]|nr:DUF1080 domain-containing protein [Planctomycetia bacterium]